MKKKKTRTRACDVFIPYTQNKPSYGASWMFLVDDKQGKVENRQRKRMLKKSNHLK